MRCRTLAGLLLSGAMFACSGGGGGTPPPAQPNPPATQYYLAFSTLCGSPPRGVVVGVEVFDQDTRASVLSGNTTNTGAFRSVSPLSINRRYRIEFTDYSNDQVFMFVEQVSLTNNPDWWKTSSPATPTANVYFGSNCSGWPSIPDPWGGGSGPTTPHNFAAVDDVFVYAPVPWQNYNQGAPSCPSCGNALKLVPVDGHEGEARILIKYNVSTIPGNASITSATLLFRDLSGATNNSSSSVAFTVHRVTSFWSESGPTWNTQPLFDPAILGSGTLTGTTFNVTVSLSPALVQGWVSGSVPNHGIIVIPIGSTASQAYKTMPSVELDGVGIPLNVGY